VTGGGGCKLADDRRALCASPDYKVNYQTALWLVYPKSNVLTVNVRIFIDFLLEKLGNVRAWTET
jgi:DNA-binding transcriptional LysR family regulator